MKAILLSVPFLLTLAACGDADCPPGFREDAVGNCLEIPQDTDAVYECWCDADYEDDYSYYSDYYDFGEVCIDPDYVEDELQLAADECVFAYDDLGYYNITCVCSCDPTGETC